MNSTFSPSRPGVAVYYRVSTGMQNLECQKPDIEALLAARGLTATVVYEEQASAAKRRTRFDRMMTDARDGAFSILVVWALDRFGRSMGGNVRDLLELDRLGVRVVSVKEPWLDTAGPVRELLVAIFSWVAQQERARLIERTKAGIAAARAGGKDWGRRSAGMVPAGERRRIIERWDSEGRPDGFKGLASVLGCASPTTAWKMHRLWLARDATPLDTEYQLPEGSQKTEMIDAAPMVVL